ncbi:MAG: hypothetical protein J6J21_00025, partial [Clostridia bacterium]|nr:hypothetical protein [Clostridia bacterium]
FSFLKKKEASSFPLQTGPAVWVLFVSDAVFFSVSYRFSFASFLFSKRKKRPLSRCKRDPRFGSRLCLTRGFSFFPYRFSFASFLFSKRKEEKKQNSTAPAVLFLVKNLISRRRRRGGFPPRAVPPRQTVCFQA